MDVDQSGIFIMHDECLKTATDEENKKDGHLSEQERKISVSVLQTCKRKQGRDDQAI